MKANQRIIDALNQRMLDELTAIDQYTVHRAQVDVWQYPGLVAYLQERIDDETKHFDTLRRWIVVLGGTPVTGPLNRVNIGQDVPQMHAFDRTAEELAIANYNELIGLCIELGDHATRQIVEGILADEVDHLVDLEAQLKQLAQMGLQNYLSAKLA